MFYFTPRQGCFSPFPHGTSSLSVYFQYLALDDGPPGFPQNFSCSVVLGKIQKSTYLVIYMAITFYGASFQKTSIKISICNFLPVRQNR